MSLSGPGGVSGPLHSYRRWGWGSILSESHRKSGRASFKIKASGWSFSWFTEFVFHFSSGVVVVVVHEDVDDDDVIFVCLRIVTNKYKMKSRFTLKGNPDVSTEVPSMNVRRRSLRRSQVCGVSGSRSSLQTREGVRFCGCGPEPGPGQRPGQRPGPGSEDGGVWAGGAARWENFTTLVQRVLIGSDWSVVWFLMSGSMSVFLKIRRSLIKVVSTES